MDRLSCVIENGNIFKLEYGQKECVGVTAVVYKELENALEEAIVKAEDYKKTAENYKNELVKHGLITIPKTPEEIQIEILRGLNDLSSVVVDIKGRLEVLENESSSNSKDSKTVQRETNEDNGSAGKSKTISK
ncbi:MAG: hypothetical protein ACRC7S_16880 [Cetobacterium sp.]